MHAGLLLPDGRPAPGLPEAARVAREIEALPETGTGRAPCAFIFDYPSAWTWKA